MERVTGLAPLSQLVHCVELVQVEHPGIALLQGTQTKSDSSVKAYDDS